MKTKKMAFAALSLLAMGAQAQLPSYDQPTCVDPVFEFRFDDTPILGTGMILYAEVSETSEVLLLEQDVEGDVNTFFDPSGVAGRWVKYHPAAIDGPIVRLRPRNGLFEHSKTYRVTVPETAFTGTVDGAAFAGHSFTFTTGASIGTPPLLTVGIDALKFNRGISSDYCTVQGALNKADEQATVFVRSGIYREHLFLAHVAYVKIRGEDPDTTIVFPDNHPDNLDHAWNRTTLLAVDCEALTIDGVTLQSVGYHNQSSEALYFRSTTKAHNLRVQYSNIVAGIHAMHVEGLAWVFKTKVSGYTNIVTANAGLVFEDCEFRTLSPQQELGVPVVVARGGSGLGQGLVFLHCSMTADENVAAGSVYFGGSVEPLQWDESSDDMLAAVRCTFGEHVSESLWLGEPTLSPSTESQGWREYQSYAPTCDVLANLTLRNPLGYTLSEAEAVFVNSREAFFSSTPLGVPETYSPYKMYPDGDDFISKLTWPGNATENLCPDPVLTIRFDSDRTRDGEPLRVGTSGRIRFYDENHELIAVIDLAQPGTNLLGPANGQWVREVVDEPVTIADFTAQIRPRSATFDFGARYTVEIDAFVFPNAMLGPWASPFMGVSRAENWTFKTAGPLLGASVFIVEPRISDDYPSEHAFCTIQGAFNFIMENVEPGFSSTVLIRNGAYSEMLFLRQNNVTIRGEFEEQSYIFAKNGESMNPGVGMSVPRNEATGVPGKQLGGRSIFLAEDCDNLVIDSIDVENDWSEEREHVTGITAPTEAITIKASENQKVTIRNCMIWGNVGALRLGGLAWVHDSAVHGVTDMISGVVVTALVEKCELHNVATNTFEGMSVTRAGARAENDVGLVVLNSDLTGNVGFDGVGGSVHLARSLNNSMWFDNVVFVDCIMGKLIAEQGWDASALPNPPAPEVSKGWREYGSMSACDVDADLSNRLHALMLTAEEAMPFSTRAHVFSANAWRPDHLFSRNPVNPKAGSVVGCADPLLSITFENPVTFHDGAFEIFEIDGTLVEAYSILHASQLGKVEVGPKGMEQRVVNTKLIWLSHDMKTVYIKLRSGLLDWGREYYVEVSPGAFRETHGDAVSVPFLGIRKESEMWSFTTTDRVPHEPIFTVDAEGTGGFCSVQGALDFIMTNVDKHIAKVVRVLPGDYNELLFLQDQDNVYIHGAGAGETVIHGSSPIKEPGFSFDGSSVFSARRCGNLVIHGITLRRDTAPEGEEGGETLFVTSDTSQRTLIFESRLEGDLETTRLDGGPAWVYASVISGGSAVVVGSTPVALIEMSTIVSVRSAYGDEKLTIAGSGTPLENDRGLVFLKSTLSAEESFAPRRVYLGNSAPGMPGYDNIAFISCHVGPHVHPFGWWQTSTDSESNPDPPVATALSGWKEYGTMLESTNEFANLSERNPAAHLLLQAEVQAYYPNREAILPADAEWKLSAASPYSRLAELFSPKVGATNVCPDPVLTIKFDQLMRGGTGKKGSIRVLGSDGMLVEELDFSQLAPSTLGHGKVRGVAHVPLVMEGNVAYIRLRNRVLNRGGTYRVEVDAEVFPDAILGGMPFFGIGGAEAWKFTVSAGLPDADNLEVNPSATSLADFCTIQGALDFLMERADPSGEKTVTIQPGVYRELLYLEGQDNVVIQGSSWEEVIIKSANGEWLNAGTGMGQSSTDIDEGQPMGGRSVFLIQDCDLVTLSGLSVVNEDDAYMSVGVGEAVYFKQSGSEPTGRLTIANAALSGRGGTLNAEGWVFVHSSMITGDRDLVWGHARVALIEASEVRMVPAPPGSNWTCTGIARSTRGGNEYPGIVFLSSTLSHAPGVEANSTYLARATKDLDAEEMSTNVAFIYSRMLEHISPMGWPAEGTCAGPPPIIAAAGHFEAGWVEFGSRDANDTRINLETRPGTVQILDLTDIVSQYKSRELVLSGYNNSQGWVPMPTENNALHDRMHPRPDSLSVCTDTWLTVEFDEAPVLGSGTVQIFNFKTSELIAAIDVSESSKSYFLGPAGPGVGRRVTLATVVIDGNTAYIRTEGLPADTEVVVDVPKSAFPGAMLNGEAFTGFADTMWMFKTWDGPQDADDTLTVDPTGELGGYCTVQGALNRAMSIDRDAPVNIVLSAGLYHEVLYLGFKNNVVIRGLEGAIVSAANWESRNPGAGASETEDSMAQTGGRSVLFVEDCDNLNLITFSVKNSYLKRQEGEFAEAIYVKSSTGQHKMVAQTMQFHSEQGTVGLEGVAWFIGSVIAGNVDFVWGSSASALFEDCEIRSVGDSRSAFDEPPGTVYPGYIAFALSAQPADKGLVFLRSRLTFAPGPHPAAPGVAPGSVFLARPGSAAQSNVAYIVCTLNGHISPWGWPVVVVPISVGRAGAALEDMPGWNEYGSTNASTGQAVDTAQRPATVRVLTAAEATSNFGSRTVVFSAVGWTPVRQVVYPPGTVGPRVYPAPGAAKVCADVLLSIQFDSPPTLGAQGQIRVLNATGFVAETLGINATAVDELGPIGQPARTIVYNPVWVEGNTVYIKLPQRTLRHLTRYYVEIDAVAFPGAQLGGVEFEGLSKPAGDWWFQTAAKPAAPSPSVPVVVSKTGPYCSVQGALHAVMDNAATQRGGVVFVKAGMYKEALFAHGLQEFVLRGEGPARTVIHTSNHEGMNPGTGALTSDGTAAGGRSVFWAKNCKSLRVDGVAVRNTHVRTSAAELSDVFFSDTQLGTTLAVNAEFSGTSTTIRADGPTLFLRSHIIGADTIVQGKAVTVIVQNSVVTSVPNPVGANGYVAVSQVPDGSAAGFVFVNTTLAAGGGVADGTVFLAKSARGTAAFDNVAFVGCKLGSHIAAGGWATARVAGHTDPNPAVAGASTGFREQGSVSASGSPIDLAATRDVGPVYLLSAGEVADGYSTVAAIHGGAWQPSPAWYSTGSTLPRSKTACKDTALRVAFTGPPVIGAKGWVRLLRADYSVAWELDFANLPRTKVLGDASASYHREMPSTPVSVDLQSATIRPNASALHWGETYYVEIDADCFPGSILGAGLRSFVGFLAKSDAWTFAVQPAPADGKLTVASAGGVFCTLQGSLDYAMGSDKDAALEIQVGPGTYTAPLFVHGKNNLRIVGVPGASAGIGISARVNSTVRTVSRDPNATNTAEERGASPVFMAIDCDMLEIANMQFKHTPPTSTSTAKAAFAFLSTTGNHRLFANKVKFIGGTKSLVVEGFSYINASLVSGTHAMVSGSPKTSLLEHGEVRMVRDFINPTSFPVVSQATCASDVDVGFVFHKMNVTRVAMLDSSAYLSRASSAGVGPTTYDTTAFLNCSLAAHIGPVGWAGVGVLQQAPNPAIATVNKGWREAESRALKTGLLIDMASRPEDEVYVFSAAEKDLFLPSRRALFTAFGNGAGWNVDGVAPPPMRPIPASALYPAPGASMLCTDPAFTITFDANTAPQLTFSGGFTITEQATGVAVDSIPTPPSREVLGPVGGPSRSVVYNRVVIRDNVLSAQVSRRALRANTTYIITSTAVVVGGEINGVEFDRVHPQHAWTFTTGAMDTSKKTVTVAKTGTGDYCTIQGALNHVMRGFAGSDEPAEIRVVPGTYEDLLFLDAAGGEVRMVPHVHGEVKVRYNNHEGLNEGTGRPVFLVADVGLLTMRYFTVENTHGRAKQHDPSEALAVIGAESRLAFHEGSIVGNQAVFRCDGYCYLMETQVRGSRDLLTGSPRAMMAEACELYIVKDAFQSQLPAGQASAHPVAVVYSVVDSLGDLGFVIFNSAIMGDSDVEMESVYFARSAGSPMYYDNVAFVICAVNREVSRYGWAGAAEGWHSPNPLDIGARPEIVRVHTGWREIGTHDLGIAHRAEAVRNATEVLQLTPQLLTESRLSTRALVFSSFNSYYGWDPLTGGPTPKTPIPTLDPQYGGGDDAAAALSLSFSAALAFLVSTALILS